MGPISAYTQMQTICGKESFRQESAEPEVYKFGIASLSMMIPLYIKVSGGLAQVPIAWKGGNAVPIPEQVPAEAFPKMMSKAFVGPRRRQKAEVQWGECGNVGPTEVNHLSLQAYVEACRGTGRNSSCLFHLDKGGLSCSGKGVSPFSFGRLRMGGKQVYGCMPWLGRGPIHSRQEKATWK